MFCKYDFPFEDGENWVVVGEPLVDGPLIDDWNDVVSLNGEGDIAVTY